MSYACLWPVGSSDGDKQWSLSKDSVGECDCVLTRCIQIINVTIPQAMYSVVTTDFGDFTELESGE